VNTDLKPKALYYGLALWASRVGGAGRRVLTAARGLRLWYIIAFVAALVAPWFIWRRRLAGRPAVALAVAAQGFVEISIEVLVIFGFQVVYGSAYLELALIVGAFMAGLAVGGLLPRPTEAATYPQRLIDIMAFAAMVAFAVPPVLYLLSRWPAAPVVVLHVVFGALAFAAGLCGGAQFVVALRAWGERGAGVLYGIDMLGSAAGAVVTAVILVPALGIGKAAIAVVALAAAVMAALAAAPRGAKRR
jgi:spermidine synthase